MYDRMLYKLFYICYSSIHICYFLPFLMSYMFQTLHVWYTYIGVV